MTDQRPHNPAPEDEPSLGLISAANPPSPPRRGLRRWIRIMLKTFVPFIVAWLALGIGNVLPFATPYDVLTQFLSLGEPQAELMAKSESREAAPLVVLQHGLARSSFAMKPIAKHLRAHGYEVWNPGYCSRSEDLATIADALATELRPRVAQGRRWHAMGHSLGGLVWRTLFARHPDLIPESLLCLGTPQRGARAAEIWIERGFGRFVLGEASARDLVPNSPALRALAKAPAFDSLRIGVIAGAKGDGEGWSDELPGDDDHRVSLEEARLPGASLLVLPLRHNALLRSERVGSEILHWLLQGRFSTD